MEIQSSSEDRTNDDWLVRLIDIDCSNIDIRNVKGNIYLISNSNIPSSSVTILTFFLSL